MDLIRKQLSLRASAKLSSFDGDPGCRSWRRLAPPTSCHLATRFDAIHP